MNSFCTKLVLATLMSMTTNVMYAQEAYSQNDVNEMAYSMGMAQTQGFKEYLESRLNVDLNYFSSFVNGLKVGVSEANNKERNAYEVGIQIGTQIVQNIIPGINKEIFGDSINIKIPLDIFMKGFLHGLDAPIDEVENAAERAKEKIQQITAIRLEEEMKKK